MTSIITSDLVPLAERGLYQGIIAATWALAASIGPPLVSELLDIFRRVLLTPIVRVV
jgi:MFS family permease